MFASRKAGKGIRKARKVLVLNYIGNTSASDDHSCAHSFVRCFINKDYTSGISVDLVFVDKERLGGAQ